MNVTNWSTLADDPDRNTCSPNLLALDEWLSEQWPGSQLLGCYNERNIRGGERPSAHSHGAALDVRYENPGPGRAAALATADVVIVNCELLGIQAIHDYVGARIWHSDRNAWKAAARSGAGYVDPNMGHAWAQWFHFETTLAAWPNTTPIADRLAAVGDDTDDTDTDDTDQTGGIDMYLLGIKIKDAPGDGVHWVRVTGEHIIDEPNATALGIDRWMRLPAKVVGPPDAATLFVSRSATTPYRFAEGDPWYSPELAGAWRTA